MRPSMLGLDSTFSTARHRSMTPARRTLKQERCRLARPDDDMDQLGHVCETRVQQRYRLAANFRSHGAMRSETCTGVNMILSHARSRSETTAKRTVCFSAYACQDLSGSRGGVDSMERPAQAHKVAGYQANQTTAYELEGDRWECKFVGVSGYDVPLDRSGRLELHLVRRRQRRLPGFDDKVIALAERKSERQGSVVGSCRLSHGVLSFALPGVLVS